VIAEGGEFKVVALISRVNPWSIVTRRQFTSVASLKGATIGVGTPADQSYYVFPGVLAANGLSMNDVRQLPISGGNDVRTNTVISGQADAVALPFESAYAIRNNPDVHALDVEAGDYAPASGNAVVVRESLIKSQPEAVYALVKSAIEMTRTFRTDQAAFEAMAQQVYTDRFTAQDFPVFWSTFKNRNIWAPNGGLDVPLLRQGIEFYTANVNTSVAGNPRVQVENVIDDQFVKRVVAELGTVAP
jgi:ABC-type nitrate/sulfonate/bicarbonate transport system substrate-binding protein